ncbi:related to dual specificity phosphatase [Ramularia collo-cygni]|uniref:protein-tyrosine-phosphatase n=1 Tax=Ramularia collo-cygni TaxID=112498 RepID=A0A2D3UUN5_9PEZI|nr:related to dual specificity phosphatase [Ramularia collo-cygni]CZT20311.1 related to dual specificity phosphatase [Ramularia collo-cygni]
MASLDRVQSDLNFYIGGLFNLRRKESLKAANITHVLSVLKLPLDEKLFENFAHKVVEVDDVDDENLLEHFESCNKFIQDGLDAGGGVLVHCAMGKSRSSTVACAYLMQRYGITASEALSRIRESRPLCEPNEGFWQQLELYFQMGTPDDMESVPAYQRWVYLQEVALSRACGQAPEADKIRFEDEHDQGSAAADYDMRCRKCRRTLATSQYLINHQATQAAASNPKNTSSTCSHYFLDPLSWMRPELEQGKLDGRLECPKCKANVGKYAWQGMQCNCGDWILPAISLAKSKIDEVKSRPQGDSNFGIRVPPSAAGRKAGAGQGNL